MTSEYLPQHASRNLAARTLSAVASTVLIAGAVLLAVTGVPAGIVHSLNGPIPPLPLAEVKPAEPPRLLVCMGPGLSFNSSSSDPVAYGAATDVVAGISPITGALVETTVKDGFSLEGALSTSLPSVISQAAEDGALAGASHQELSNVNVRGLALSECQEPRTETWLVAGDTTTGRQAALSLSNPGAVPATVNVDVWGATGPISTPLGQGILLPPGTQRVFVLSGFAPDEPSPVVRVSSVGVGIVATLHGSIVRGLLPDGLYVATGQPGPSLQRVIPGIYLAPEDVIGPLKGKEGYADLGGALRLLSPDADSLATVTILRANGEKTTVQVELVAGQVRDLTLDELGSGDLGVIVDSTEPIVAGVRQGVGNDSATDTSWVGSSYPIVGTALVAVPAVGEARLTFANPGDAAVSVNLDGRDVTVPAGAVESRPISGTHEIVAPTEIYAAVSVRAETLMGNLQVLPTAPPQESVRVIVR